MWSVSSGQWRHVTDFVSSVVHLKLVDESEEGSEGTENASEGEYATDEINYWQQELTVNRVCVNV